MAVNGVEIKVGQVWRTREGRTAKVVNYAQGKPHPWAVEISDGTRDVLDSSGCTYRPGAEGHNDLMFLVSDPDVAVERRQRNTPNGPLRRKDDYPTLPAGIPDLAAPADDFVASMPGVLDEAPTPESTKCLGGIKLAPRQAESNATARAEADAEVAKNSSLDVQIGGGHYKQFAIQPVEFIHKNGIPFIEGNCIKYLARWRDKGGVQDLEKVKHYIDLLIEMETPK